MRKFIRIAITMSMLAGLAGTAVAGDDKAKAPTPAPAAVKAPTPAPTGGKPAPAPTPTPAPAADKAAPAAQMAPPAPPAEIAAAAKAMAGTWKCNGSMMMPDGTSAPMKATMKTKIALDKFWAQTSFAETKKNGFKFESYRTFDGKKWHGVQVDNMGGQEVSWSDGPKENKTVWETTSRSAMGEAKARHYEEVVGKEIKMWGEYSMDKGKNVRQGVRSHLQEVTSASRRWFTRTRSRTSGGCPTS